MRGSTRGGSQSCSSQPSWHARQQELSDLLSTNPASAMSHLAATALPWALLPSLEQIRLGLAGDRSHRRSPAWQRLPRRCAQGGKQPAPLPGRCVAPGTLLHSHGVAARLRHARVLLAWSWKLTTKQRGFLSGKRFTPSLSTHEKHQTCPPRAFSSLSLSCVEEAGQTSPRGQPGACAVSLESPCTSPLQEASPLPACACEGAGGHRTSPRAVRQQRWLPLRAVRSPGPALHCQAAEGRRRVGSWVLSSGGCRSHSDCPRGGQKIPGSLLGKGLAKEREGWAASASRTHCAQGQAWEQRRCLGTKAAHVAQHLSLSSFGDSCCGKRGLEN